MDTGTLVLIFGAVGAIGTVLLVYFAWRAHVRARVDPRPAPPPRPDYSEPAPARPLAVTKAFGRPETVYDGTVVVESGGHEAIPLQLELGDRVKGVLRSRGNYDFDADLLDERNYGLFVNGRRFRSIWKERGVSVTTIDAHVASEGSYYLVLDLYGKQLDRQVSVRVQRVPTPDSDSD